jgi:hypothetical protein
MEDQKCIVKYQVATYSGEIEVYCDENDDNDFIINKAKGILRRKVGAFPFGYESFKVISRS